MHTHVHECVCVHMLTCMCVCVFYRFFFFLLKTFQEAMGIHETQRVNKLLISGKEERIHCSPFSE